MRKVASPLLSLACVSLLGVSATAFANAGAAHPETTTTAKVEAKGGEGGHKAGDPVPEELHLGTFLVTIIIFLALLAVLSKFAWKPILTGLKNREHAIRDSIEAAKKAKDEALRTTAELEAKMAEVQRQASQQLAQARADAQKAADSIKAQAEADSAALKERTLREINAAKQQALSEINSHAAELGTAVARRILQRDMNAGDQQKLVEESLAELAKKN